MARYIDADKFKSNLEKAMEKMHLICGIKCVDVGAVITALDRQPTADVAPRAEVAREIFEELESLLSANQSGEFRGDSIEWFDYFDLHLAEDIAELKKKYTDATGTNVGRK